MEPLLEEEAATFFEFDAMFDQDLVGGKPDTPTETTKSPGKSFMEATQSFLSVQTPINMSKDLDMTPDVVPKHDAMSNYFQELQSSEVFDAAKMPPITKESKKKEFEAHHQQRIEETKSWGLSQEVVKEWMQNIQVLEHKMASQIEPHVLQNPIQLSDNEDVQQLILQAQKEREEEVMRGTPSPGHYTTQDNQDDEEVPKYSKRGRKKKKDTKEYVSKEERAAKRREANRLSAAASRKRKKRYVQDLENTIKSLSGQNALLIEHLKDTQKEQDRLKSMIAQMRTSSINARPVKKKKLESGSLDIKQEAIGAGYIDEKSWFDMSAIPKGALFGFVFLFVFGLCFLLPSSMNQYSDPHHSFASSEHYVSVKPSQSTRTMNRQPRKILSVTCKNLLAQQVDRIQQLSEQVQDIQTSLNSFVNDYSIKQNDHQSKSIHDL
mmetsp:Transcript_91432/g.217863  ORF Transcript_91432/g.217863 Transcript_91432/m.217863 type:complete len:436 (+) Transcript_91432:50-1357(+)